MNKFHHEETKGGFKNNLKQALKELQVDIEKLAQKLVKQETKRNK